MILATGSGADAALELTPQDLTAFGGELQRLSDGTTVVTLTQRREAMTDLAVRAARCALRLRDNPPGAGIVLVRSGRAITLTPRAAGLLPALERGLGELESAVSGEPQFDPRTARRTFALGTSDYLQALLMGSGIPASTATPPRSGCASSWPVSARLTSRRNPKSAPSFDPYRSRSSSCRHATGCGFTRASRPSALGSIRASRTDGAAADGALTRRRIRYAGSVRPPPR